MKKKSRKTKVTHPQPTAEPVNRSPLIRRAELICALILTLVVVLLHAYRASQAGGLWRDEVSTIGAATLPSLGKLWDSLIYESSFPLLVYLVVHSWTGVHWLGSGDGSLRVLGALIGVGGLAALWLTTRMLGRRVPIVALVFLGLNATVIQWGDSMRAYGLAAIWILLVYGAVWKFIESPTPARLALATVLSFLSVQSLYQNAFLVLAICFGAFLVCLRRRVWKTILLLFAMGAVSAISLIAYLPKIAVSKAIHMVADLPMPFSYVLQMFATAVGSGSSFLLWTWLLFSGVCIVAAIRVIAQETRKRESSRRLDLAIYSLTVLLASAVMYVLLVKALNFLPQAWYFVVLVAIIAVSLDDLVGLVATTVPARAASLALVLVLAAATIYIGRKQVSERLTNIDVIAPLLAERSGDGDFIVVSPWYVGVTFRYYFHGNTPWTTIPPISDLQLTRYDLLKEQMMKADPMQPVLEGAERALRSGKSVWAVGGLAAPPEGQLPPRLPPAPNAPSGWNNGPYISAWILQLGAFIQSHATAMETMPVPIRQPVNVYEDSPVLVFHGWRP